MEEIWKDIPGYEVLYKISNCGQIKNYKTNRILKSGKSWNGYLQVTLRKNKISKTARINRFVLLTFVGPCPFGMECRHLNGIKTDNRLCNLT